MGPYVVTFETGRRYRVHKSYVWVGPLIALVVVVAAVLLNGASGWVQLAVMLQEEGFRPEVLPVVLGAVGGFVLLWLVVMGIYALAYKHMSFGFDPLEFTFQSGVFVKKRVSVPYEKVQSVNHRASLIQRLVGVCTVTVDSAGGAANKAVRVPYVTLQVAERLRHDLFVRKAAAAAGAPVEYVGEEMPPAAVAAVSPVAPAPGGAAPNVLDDALQPVGDWRGLWGGATVAEEPVTFEYSLSNKELVLASVSHPGPLVAGVIAALALLACVGGALTQSDWIAAAVLAFGVPGALVGAVLVWALGSLGMLLGYGGFKVRRRGSRIEVERGLITRNFSGIDVNRIQFVQVRQSMLRRLLHHSELSLGRIGTSSQNSSENQESSAKGLVIHPFVANGSVDALLNGLLPEFADRPVPEECEKLPPAALGRNVRRRCLWFNWVLWAALLCLGCWALTLHLILADDPTADVAKAQLLFDQLVAAGVVVAAVAVALSVAYYAVSAVLWARHSRFGWNDRWLLLRNDGLYTALCIIPRSKIQCGVAGTNPFQRRRGLATLRAVTAAGVKRTTVQLLDVPASRAEAYREWLS